MNRFLRKSHKGSTLIILIVLIAVLSTVVLGTLAVTASSLNQSRSILFKADTSYIADSVIEDLLYYINLMVEDAKRRAIEYYFDANGNLTTNDDGSNPNEPEDIKHQLENAINDYTNGVIDQATFNSRLTTIQDKLKQGFSFRMQYYIRNFFDGLPDAATVKFPSSPGVSSFPISSIDSWDVLKDYLKSHVSGNHILDGIDKSVQYYSDKLICLFDATIKDTVSKAQRVLRCEIEIPTITAAGFNSLFTLSSSTSSSTTTTPGSTGGSSSTTPTSSTPPNSVYSIFNYAMYTQSSINTGNNFHVEGGNIYSGGDLTVGNNSLVRPWNIITKGNIIFNNSSEINVVGILYAGGSITFNSGNPSLKAKVLYSGSDITFGNNMNAQVDELYCRNLYMNNDNNNTLVINKVISAEKIELGAGKIVIKSGARLYCKELIVRNNGKIIIEDNADINCSSIRIEKEFYAPNDEIKCENLYIGPNAPIGVKKVVVSGNVELNNINANRINIVDKIYYKNSLVGNLPSSLQTKFQNDSSISYQYTAPSLPQEILDIQSYDFNNIIDWSNINGEAYRNNNEGILITEYQINNNDSIFPNSSNRAHPAYLFLLSRQGINLPPSLNLLNGSIIAQNQININGGGNFTLVHQSLNNNTQQNLLNNGTIEPTPPPGSSGSGGTGGSGSSGSSSSSSSSASGSSSVAVTSSGGIFLSGLNNNYKVLQLRFVIK